MYKGIAASSGIAIAKAFLLQNKEVTIEQNQIEAKEIEKEREKFRQALVDTSEQLRQIKEKTEQEMGHDKGAIFAAHLMFLQDPMLVDEVENKIAIEKIKAVAAVKQVISGLEELFFNMEDNYMRERVADIKDVGRRLVNNLMGIEDNLLADIKEKVVIIALDLTPSDTAQMNKEYILGFATEIGGRTSHSAIMARTLEIPAVVGLGPTEIKSGDLVVIDGNEGIVIANPNEETLEFYQQKLENSKRENIELQKLVNLPSMTKDGHVVKLEANIGTPKDIKGLLAVGAEGVGLYRSEFLYMDRPELPSEEEQFQAYKIAAEQLEGKPVTIRTLDIGGDKKLPYLDLPEEMNPFLGFRAIRISLEKKEVFRQQLRAILRASAYGKIRIMYPMISNIEEIREANAILQEVRAELEEKNIAYDKGIKVGIMVEIPSAALIADIIAKEVDFFSIGTNDLCQYTLAVDRMNSKIAYLYQPFHPAVLRLIKMIIEAAHQEGKSAAMCGEMAGEPLASIVLLGLGLDEFSMSASSILIIRKLIRSISFVRSKEIADRVIQLATAEEIELFLKKIMEEMEEEQC